MVLEPDDSFDDEIVEIFVEEVDDVLAQIDQNFPLWEQNAGNDTALKEVRRAFHTLKGSGRMVQANDLGELAWAIENMLNRVIDGTLRVNQYIYELVKQVRRVSPTLVKAFKNKQAASIAGVNINQLIDQANDIVAGKAVSSLDNFSPAAQKKEAEVPTLAAAVDPISAAVDMVDVEALKDRIGELTASLDDLKRQVVSLSTQSDAMSSQLRQVPKDIDPEAINRSLQTADKEIQELKYFVKASSEQGLREMNEAQKRMSTKVDQELRMIQDLSTQIHADMDSRLQSYANEMGKQIKLWALSAAIICGGIAAAVGVLL